MEVTLELELLMTDLEIVSDVNELNGLLLKEIL